MRGGVEAISEGGRDMARSKVEKGGKNGGEEVRKWQIKGLTRCECIPAQFAWTDHG